jgi:hypothetical protein
MKKITSIALLAFMMACNGSQNDLKKMEDEVMAIHDEVMPKMGDIMSMKEALKKNIAAIDSNSVGYAAVKAQSDSLSYLLVKSDDQMMDWMNDYNPDTLVTIKPEEGMKYLEEQKAILNQIKESTNKNLDAVKSFLKK